MHSTQMDVNAASLLELQTLPGIGPVIAQRIMDKRPFDSVADLLQVNGVGRVKLSVLAPLVSVESSEATDKTERSLPVVDINTATMAELKCIRGVGPALAQRIIEARPFYRQEDLLAVRGIGMSSYLKLRHQITVAQAQSNTSADPDKAGIDAKTVAICRELDSCVRDSVFQPDRIGRIQLRGQSVLVASWNIRNISKRKETMLLSRIAEVLSEFDLVALQEIRDLLVLKRLKTMLPGWDYVASDAVGRVSADGRTRTERFAFIYRRGVVRLSDECGSLYPDPSQIFVRPPFIARFETATESGLVPLAFTLVNVHITFAQKEARLREIQEIQVLAAELQALEAADQATVLVLGDFNLAPQDDLRSKDTPLMALLRSPLSTTVFGKLYDNIWLDLAAINPSKVMIESGVYRTDWRYYGRAKALQGTDALRRESRSTKLKRYMARIQCSYELSDHCPVWIAFQGRVPPEMATFSIPVKC